jgi:hypothetical protein
MPRAGNLTEENSRVERDAQHGAFRSHHTVTCNRGVAIRRGLVWLGFIDNTQQ